VKTVQAKQHHN